MSDELDKSALEAGIQAFFDANNAIQQCASCGGAGRNPDESDCSACNGGGFIAPDGWDPYASLVRGYLSALPTPPGVASPEAGVAVGVMDAVLEAAMAVNLQAVRVAQSSAAQHGHDPLYRDYMNSLDRTLDEAIQGLNDWNRDANGSALTSPVSTDTREAALEWIEWDGGPCPIADDVTVSIKRRGGEFIERIAHAGDFNWGRYDRPLATDIIAYRVFPAPSNSSTPKPGE